MVSLVSYWHETWKVTRFFHDQMVLAQHLVDTKDLLEKLLPFYLIWKPVLPEKNLWTACNWRRRRREKYEFASKAAKKIQIGAEGAGKKWFLDPLKTEKKCCAKVSPIL